MPITRTAETRVDATPEQLFDLLADVTSWPLWDDGIADVACAEPLPQVGTQFFLTPKGGPKVRLEIVSFDRPHCLADIAYLPLARMLTRHELRPVEGGTLVRMRIEMSGPLGFLFDRLIARQQIADAGKQARSMADYAHGWADGEKRDRKAR